MARMRRWSFPVIAVSWLVSSAHVLIRLANLHATLAAAERRQSAPESHSTTNAQALAQR